MNISRRGFSNIFLSALGATALPPAQAAGMARSKPANAVPAAGKAQFLWGTSTSAYQTEGSNSNTDIWLLEHANTGMFKEKSGDACDHYNRFREDIKLIAGLGFNSYRFSVEWARVEPEKGEFSIAQLDHYRAMAEACRASGLSPMITLHHFSSPLWFARQGGWEDPEAPALFSRYCGKVAAHLGSLVGAACTINEINVPAIIQRRVRLTEEMRAHILAAVSASIVSTNFSTFLTGRPEVLQKALLQAHQRAREAFKTAAPNVPVGMNLAIADDQAVDGGEAKLKEFQELCYDSYLRLCAQDDFIAIQTYTRNLVGPEGDRKPAEEARKTQMGWEFYPQALEHTIRYTASLCPKPIIVTENGIATGDDAERIEYIKVALSGLARCRQDGIQVDGYYHWSAFDNFEWNEGYRPTFGLVSVDRSNFKRTVKPSGRYLGSVARAGHI